jgi:ABC-type multidrug transport system fused ATPase/permease subunit
VRQCDRIYLLERGEAKASGTYDQLITTSQQLVAMYANR